MTKQEMVAKINELVHEGLGFRNLDFSILKYRSVAEWKERLGHAERAVEIKRQIEAVKEPWMDLNPHGFPWWEVYAMCPNCGPQDWQAAWVKVMVLYRELNAHWAKV